MSVFPPCLDLHHPDVNAFLYNRKFEPMNSIINELDLRLYIDLDIWNGELCIFNRQMKGPMDTKWKGHNFPSYDPWAAKLEMIPLFIPALNGKEKRTVHAKSVILIEKAMCNESREHNLIIQIFSRNTTNVTLMFFFHSDLQIHICNAMTI